MAKKAILCIDDENIILTSLRVQLRKHFGNDYIYEFAEDANEAFEIIEEFREDGIQLLVVVSDWLMPEMKGDEFLIKVHQKHPEIVKIMLTGQADQDAVERAKKQANLHSYITKPWQEDDLYTAIDNGLKALK